MRFEPIMRIGKRNRSFKGRNKRIVNSGRRLRRISIRWKFPDPRWRDKIGVISKESPSSQRMLGELLLTVTNQRLDPIRNVSKYLIVRAYDAGFGPQR
jgi:hypothetical protein